jgi:hypothetical protein
MTYVSQDSHYEATEPVFGLFRDTVMYYNTIDQVDTLEGPPKRMTRLSARMNGMVLDYICS